MDKLTFSKEMIRMYGLPWIMIFLLILSASIALSVFTDPRWIIIALMLVCIAAPMILAYFYIYHGLKEISVLNAIHHNLTVDDEGILSTIFSAAMDKETKELKYAEIYSKFLPYSEISEIRSGITSFLILPKRRDKGFVWLPVSAFKSRDDLVAAIATINESIRTHNI